MTEAEMYALWAYAHEVWANYPLPPRGSPEQAVRASAWMRQLGDLTGDAIRAALDSPALARREWFPPLGLIREQALLDLAAASGQPVAPDVDEAWREVSRQIRSVGQMGDPVWSHPAVAETVANVGWRILCMGDEQDQGRFRQFRDFYGLAAGRHRAALAPGPTMAALDGAGYPRGLTSGEG